MLIQFNFKNYKSFRDEAVLDMSATKMQDFSERVVRIGSERILPVAAIYGANASGKSVVYNAFRFMTEYAMNSFSYGDDVDDYMNYRPAPFLFDSESAARDTAFEIYFTIPGDEKTYNYGFCLNDAGVTEEWFNSKARTQRKYKTVFYRGDGELDLSGLPKSSRKNIKIALEKQVLIASLGAKLKVEKCKMIRDWFMGNQLMDFADAGMNFSTDKISPVAELMKMGFADDDDVRRKVVRYLATFDRSIRGFRVERQKDGYRIYAQHDNVGGKGISEIPLSSESSGTLKMLALYPELQYVLDRGSVMFVDELNARLHPLLVRNFILTFLNHQLNPNHAQLVFTSHDTWLLSRKMFRRDEIWFTEKNEDGLSSLYSLADFVNDDGSRVRKDESYGRNYLLGKYGAIPELQKIEL